MADSNCKGIGDEVFPLLDIWRFPPGWEQREYGFGSSLTIESRWLGARTLLTGFVLSQSLGLRGLATLSSN